MEVIEGLPTICLHGKDAGSNRSMPTQSSSRNTSKKERKRRSHQQERTEGECLTTVTTRLGNDRRLIAAPLGDMSEWRRLVCICPFTRYIPSLLFALYRPPLHPVKPKGYRPQIYWLLSPSYFAKFSSLSSILLCLTRIVAGVCVLVGLSLLPFKTKR